MKVSKFLGAGSEVTLSVLMLAACGSSSSSSKSTRKTLNWTVDGFPVFLPFLRD
ncbi:peptide ABC transporter substrate-binding protein [Lactobacillus delbrueckii]|uniref:peptide ABC transporter substrate-binding protein n=1 Tax=Lactobacillus delbrueckii TaxID=1584 RepID=UPI00358DC18E